MLISETIQICFVHTGCSLLSLLTLKVSFYLLQECLKSTLHHAFSLAVFTLSGYGLASGGSELEEPRKDGEPPGEKECKAHMSGQMLTEPRRLLKVLLSAILFSKLLLYSTVCR